MSEKYTMNDLLDIMAKLRDREHGCPWDIEQNFQTIAPYTIEEAYEVDEAIRNNDMPALKDELGDLLFQTVFHTQMASEAELFTFEDVVQNVSEKMVRRHPHVFGDGTVEDADAQTKAWEEHKAAERKRKAQETGHTPSALDGVSLSLPSLQRALKLQNRAARVGFDWPETGQVIDKIQEECNELLYEVQNGGPEDKVKEEFGDLLFVISNLARHFKLDPEECLRSANAKFDRRFRNVEKKLTEIGKSPETSTLEEMDALWDEVKKEERRAD
ncbi:nucleoside triphosphate pyrophosphohydrolase [Kordiimonas laminariae]|uniref:nucleoside triphosphate pyrophosphohydrolase n=1 Tax=Kordiimonas laminariae TaxID=2917717 RepID=UPI001FF4E661|nr:nucleoside triphosphate pyrophosphohydrolase [Kordiimonas laminariae]MCK0071063.1 nucleoside triphosphate pyrophosphohydrolase [Kordiimonas laminariae]